MHVPDPLARRDTSMRTSRVLLGESLPHAQATRTQALVNNESNGRRFDIISGKPRPLQPTIDERRGNERHAHPSLASLVNPLQR